ncbi:uncharacterized protein A4U43_C08F22380 [Asparagus officinalis]|uniref:transcription termination factor MTERF15, mitochondrial-like n=1 Tax=Asparagus officinalis TaxID=4686 RepID=UPI00098DED0D|nr:transcription termination factor MTERF15, mitochondrial-like [Asparagus officinalis]ONK60765.1 uncharacterized protein A4U43_C08F22380 [Asparagus officinalis]
MKTHGFSDAQINKIVSGYPKCLAINLDKTLAPKFRALNEIGFSGSDLTDLISSNCRVLCLDFNRKILPKIQFWQSLLGSREQLIKNLKRSNSFIADSVEKAVKPNVAFLRSCGVSDERIRMVARRSPRFVTRRPQALAEAASPASRVENEMGIARGSGMFVWALLTLSSVSKIKLNGSLEIMKKFGWSEADFISASSKAPSILDISHRTLSKKMEFLLKEAECEPVYVAQRPLLLMYSLEKRLIPRYEVVKILRSRGLLDREPMLASIMSYSEKGFMDKFIIPHKHKVPQLQEIYVDGCGK